MLSTVFFRSKAGFSLFVGVVARGEFEAFIFPILSISVVRIRINIGVRLKVLYSATIYLVEAPSHFHR